MDTKIITGFEKHGLNRKKSYTKQNNWHLSENYGDRGGSSPVYTVFVEPPPVSCPSPVGGQCTITVQDDGQNSTNPFP